MECTNSNHCQIAQLMQSWSCTGYSINVVGPTGIGDNTQNQDIFKLAPNPAENFTKIIFPSNLAGKAEVSVYNIVGEKIYNMVHSVSGILRINTGQFPSGMYIVKVVVNENSYTEQLIVK